MILATKIAKISIKDSIQRLEFDGGFFGLQLIGRSQSRLRKFYGFELFFRFLTFFAILRS